MQEETIEAGTFYRDDLDDRCGCWCCGSFSDELRFTPRCHAGHPLTVAYNKGGFLRLICSTCKDVVARIAVADRDGEVNDRGIGL